MHFTLTGINHHTAPIEVREKAAVNADGLQCALLSLRRHTRHAVILSTCNRTEVYASGLSAAEVAASCAGYMRETLNMTGSFPAPYIYTYDGMETFKHLCSVACGLDSMVIGEYEVLGQVRQALAAAEKAGMADLPLRHLFHSAIRTGRRAREETGISKNALSISSIAVNKAIDIIPDIKSAKIIVIGAGEAGRLALRIARSRDISGVVVMSRTEHRAAGLAAQYGARPVNPGLLVEEMRDADIVITCAASPHPVLHCWQVRDATVRREWQPLVILDIAMPRNVEPAVKEIPGVHLYNIDDLNDIAGGHRLERESEIRAVESIIEDEAGLLLKWWQAYNMRPVIKSLVKKAEQIRTEQCRRSLKKLPSLTDEEIQSVDLLTRSIVDKVLREPIMFLKSGEAHADPDIIRRLFGIAGVSE